MSPLTLRKHSRIFVSDEHLAWAPEKARKLRKKYGNLVRSQHTKLSDMLAAHQQEVFDIMQQQTKAWRDQRETERLAQLANATSVAANGGHGLGRASMRLPPAARVDESVEDLRGGRLRGNGTPGPRSPTKLPPMGTFEISSPLRSPAKRP